MRNQGIKAAGEVMSATPGAPAGHASPPQNIAELAQEIRKDEYPEELLAFVSALFEICTCE